MTNKQLRDGEFPTSGEVAYFMKLHLDTAVRKDRIPHQNGEWIYSVDAKRRPMIVLRHLRRKNRGVHWFLALPTTTKEQDFGVLYIGKCIEAGKDTFVEMWPQLVPSTLLDGGPTVKPCDEFAFMNALKIIRHKLVRTGDQGTWVRFPD